jgi:hypothetical protein
MMHVKNANELFSSTLYTEHAVSFCEALSLATRRRRAGPKWVRAAGDAAAALGMRCDGDGIGRRAPLCVCVLSTRRAKRTF